MVTVLIVDDEFGIAELLESAFVDDGHRALTASNGRQALAQMEKTKPDVVLLDFMMPVMDGPGFMKAMRADPRYAAIPVVMMSSMPEESVAERCDGYVAFIRKPFILYEVVDQVIRLLGRKG